VITAGPWASEALHGIVPLRVTRQVMAWIQPMTGVGPFLPERFPVFLCEDPEGGYPGYGFPAMDGPAGGIKTAIHGSDGGCTPETVDREIHETDLRGIIDRLKVRMPALDGEVVRAKTCLYTMTPDEHFVIGKHPQFSSCSIACGFSGHGFKFASVVGEILADLAIHGSTAYPIGLFSPKRFGG
jgi:sarcosine oxidase